MIWENLFEMVAANGIFAVLFFLLLMLEIKDSRNREERYQNVVEKLTDELHIVNEIDEDVDEILRRVIDIDKERSNEEIK